MSRDPTGGWGCQVLMGHRVSPGEAVGKRERRNLVLLTTVGAIAPPSINHRPMTGNSFGFSRVISSYLPVIPSFLWSRYRSRNWSLKVVRSLNSWHFFSSKIINYMHSISGDRSRENPLSREAGNSYLSLIDFVRRRRNGSKRKTKGMSRKEKSWKFVIWRWRKKRRLERLSDVCSPLNGQPSWNTRHVR